MEISDEALRQLLLRSGNRCAFPSCRRRLGDRCPPFLAPIAGSDPLVLCDVHYRTVTENREAWPVEALRQMRTDHQQWVELDLDPHYGRPQTHLPPQPAPFIGREADIAALDEIITVGEPTGALVSLYGMPGGGKSALAVWYAHQRAEAFPDGRLYVDLTDDVDLFGAADLIRSTFRLPGSGSTAGNISAGLGPRRALLIFDNVPDEATVDRVRAPAPAITLIASRQGLGLIEAAVAIRVTPLAAEAALDLLATLIGRSAVVADTAAATDIVDRCGRLPLALRLAAAQLRRRSWSLRNFADRLADEVAALQTLDLGREETGVWASCLISYRQLDEHAARLFRLIAVSPFEEFDERLTLHLDAGEGAAALDALLDCHLFEDRGDGRSGMHRLLRGVGRRLHAQQESDPPDDEVTMLAADLLTAQAEEALSTIQPVSDQGARRQSRRTWPSAEESKRAGTWLAWNRRNLENALAQLRTCGAADRIDQCVAILARLYRMTGDHAAGIGLYESLADAALTDKEKLDRLLGVASAQLAARRAEEAAATLLTAQAVCRAAGLAEPAAIFRMLADVAFQRHDLGHARELFQTAISEAHLQESPLDAARALNNLGLTHMELGEWARAEALFGEAGRLFESIGDRFHQAAAYSNLGLMHYRAGDYAAARAAYTRVLEFYENLGDLQHQAELHNNLGIVNRLLGQPETALTSFGLSILLARQVNDKITEARATMNAARAHVDLGDVDTAHTLYEQSKWLHIATSNRVGQAHVADNLAEYVYSDDPERALAAYEEAIRLRRGYIDGIHLGKSLVAAANVLDALGRPDQASAYREEAVPLLELTDTTLAEQVKATLRGKP